MGDESKIFQLFLFPPPPIRFFTRFCLTIFHSSSLSLVFKLSIFHSSIHGTTICLNVNNIHYHVVSGIIKVLHQLQVETRSYDKLQTNDVKANIRKIEHVGELMEEGIHDEILKCLC